MIGEEMIGTGYFCLAESGVSPIPCGQAALPGGVFDLWKVELAIDIQDR